MSKDDSPVASCVHLLVLLELRDSGMRDEDAEVGVFRIL